MTDEELKRLEIRYSDIESWDDAKRLVVECRRLRETITRLRVLLGDFNQLVAESAPLSWAACGNQAEAVTWEKKATALLDKHEALKESGK